MGVRRIGGMAGVACALFTCSTGIAAADPVDLSDPQFNSSGPLIVIDPQGNTTVAMSRENGPNASMGSVATRIATSSTFTGPVDLPPAPAGAKISSIRAMDVGADGTVAVATINNNITPAQFQVAVRHPGQAVFSGWFTASLTGEAKEGDVAVTPQGDVVAVWKQDTGTNAVIQTWTLPAGGPTLSAPVNISNTFPRGQDDGFVDVDSNAKGDITAVWSRNETTGGMTPQQFNRIQAAHRAAGASAFGLAVSVSSAIGSSRRPSVAVDPQGGDVVVWEQQGIHSTATDLDPSSAAVVAIRRPGESFYDQFQTLTPGKTSANDPEAAVDSKGNVTLVWSRSIPIDIMGPPQPQVPDRVQSSTKRVGDTQFSDPVFLSDGQGSSTEAKIAINSAGDVAVAWERSAQVVQVARRSSTATTFSDPQTLGSDRKGRHPQLAVGPDGDMTAVWTSFIDVNGIGRGIIRYDNIDTTAPVIDAVNVPPEGNVGTAVPISVVAHDRLSPLQPAKWEFGDGAGGDGSAVTHTYAGLSTFTVKVTVTDALGNSTSTTRQIVISPAGGGGQKDTTKPRILKPSLSPRRFRAAKSGGELARRKARRVGTTLTFKASEAGKLTIVVERKRTGRRLGKRCVAKRRKGRKCTFYSRVGTFKAVSVKAGSVRLFPTGRFKTRKLSPGSYRFTLQLTDAAKNKSVKVPVTFTIIR